MTFDLFWYAGRSACSIAAHAGRTMDVSLHCNAAQYTNMGWIAVGLVVLVAYAIWHAGRESRRNDNYLP
jgi:hypothetical protein